MGLIELHVACPACLVVQQLMVTGNFIHRRGFSVSAMSTENWANMHKLNKHRFQVPCGLNEALVARQNCDQVAQALRLRVLI